MLDRKPGALSGGQRQRVALGRAIVRDPKVFLFDEPLSNLDAKMRVHMRSEISRLHTQLTTTMVYVTHDQVEAMTMGDRICVMRDGLIMQVADPLTLYRQPENIFVAGFIGSPPMNLLKGKVQKLDSGLAFVEDGQTGALTIPLRGKLESLAAKYVGKPVIFGIRPEHLSRPGERSEPHSSYCTDRDRRADGLRIHCLFQGCYRQLDRAGSRRTLVPSRRATDRSAQHGEGSSLRQRN